LKGIGQSMKKWKMSTILPWALFVALAASFVYNLVDNQRFRIMEQEIVIDRLPRAFDGFKILQISDLHGRYFGDQQAVLIQAINQLPYDMIAFTGDMNSSNSSGSTLEDSQAILVLLDGIQRRESMFWVDGNTGPYAVERFGSAQTGELTSVGKLLLEKGCQVLTSPLAVERGNEKIWITPALSEINFDGAYHSLTGDEVWLGGSENYRRIQTHYQEVYASFLAIRGNGEVKILLEHTPRQTNLTEAERAMMGDLDYDLILAGHYHGGQWRLPLIGAVYIPSPTHGINNSGWFPAQNDVKGWSFFGRTPQYVSAGLGASGHSVWTDFRLFNTPEINLITLKSRS
jgi:uncharacterized protein